MNAQETELEPAVYPLPEAPASLNFTGITSKGWRVQFTLRDTDETALLGRFSAFVRALEELHVRPEGTPAPNATPAPGAATPPAPPPAATAPAAAPAPAPAAAPVNGHSAEGEYEEIDITHVKCEMSTNGQKVLKAFGGPVKKFGVVAWPEVAALAFNLDDMQPGNEYTTPGQRARLLKQEGKFKKVVAFI